jgi:PII-like signaling protein
VGDDVPIEVTIVESSERIDEFLADTADLLEGRVVMRRAVQVVLDRARPRKPRRP